MPAPPLTAPVLELVRSTSWDSTSSGGGTETLPSIEMALGFSFPQSGSSAAKGAACRPCVGGFRALVQQVTTGILLTHRHRGSDALAHRTSHPNPQVLSAQQTAALWTWAQGLLYFQDPVGYTRFFASLKSQGNKAGLPGAQGHGWGRGRGRVAQAGSTPHPHHHPA